MARVHKKAFLIFLLIYLEKLKLVNWEMWEMH